MDKKLIIILFLIILLMGCHSSKSKVTDTTAPVISSVSNRSIADTTASISWLTDEPATSQVEYGTTSSYGTLTVEDTNMVTSRSITISGLTGATTYHYRVLSKDAAGNLATGSDNTFVTSPADVTPPVISNIYYSDLTSSSVIIKWTTDEPATSLVEYGYTGSYGSTTSKDLNKVTSHSVNLASLITKTTYHYRVKSEDTGGNLATSYDNSFVTP